MNKVAQEIARAGLKRRQDGMRAGGDPETVA